MGKEDQRQLWSGDLTCDFAFWQEGEGVGSQPNDPMVTVSPVNDWDSVTEPIMHMVFDYLSARERKNCRLVSKRWSQMIVSNTKATPPLSLWTPVSTIQGPAESANVATRPAVPAFEWILQ